MIDFDGYRKRIQDRVKNGTHYEGIYLISPGVVDVKVKYSVEDDMFFPISHGRLMTRDDFEDLTLEMESFFNAYSDEQIEQINKDAELEHQGRQSQSKVNPPEKSGFVYLMQSVEGYKIGMSATPKARLSSMKSHAPSIKLIHTFEADQPLVAEGYLHRRFSDSRISGEWFDLAPEDVERIKGIVRFKGDRFVESEVAI